MVVALASLLEGSSQGKTYRRECAYFGGGLPATAVGNHQSRRGSQVAVRSRSRSFFCGRSDSVSSCDSIWTSRLARSLSTNSFCFCKVRVWIRRGNQVAVTLQKTCGHGSKRDVLLQPLENSMVRQVRILDDLAVIGSLLRYPALQFHHQPFVFNQHASNLNCRSRHPAQVFLCQVRGLFNTIFVPALFARPPRPFTLLLRKELERRTKRSDSSQPILFFILFWFNIFSPRAGHGIL